MRAVSEADRGCAVGDRNLTHTCRLQIVDDGVVASAAGGKEVAEQIAMSTKFKSWYGPGLPASSVENHRNSECVRSCGPDLTSAH